VALGSLASESGPNAQRGIFAAREDDLIYCLASDLPDHCT